MLELWDERLAELSYQIYTYRKEYIKRIQEKIEEIHNMITNCGKQQEKIKIEYITGGKNKEEFYKNLINNRFMDIKRGFTQSGVHRDDIKIYINDKEVDTYGSQGQQRTVVLSLKITELSIIEEETGEEPILLLDDFMSELDENRRNNLTNAIKNNQVFITCTDKIIVQQKNNAVYHIENAKLT